MSRNPFGSIFGKIIEPKNAKVEKEAELEKASQAPTASQTPDVPKEPKEPFSRTTPQFKSTTDLEPKDPHVILEQARLDKVQKEADYNALVKEIENLKKKILSITFYQGLLISFSKLPVSQKDEVASWVRANSLAIKNIVNARNIQKLTNKTMAKNEDLDIEIAHLENLLKLKDKGIDVVGTPSLKYYQPSKAHNKADPPTKGAPTIKYDGPNPQLFALTKLGMGQVDADYFEKFKDSRPSYRSYFKKRKHLYKETHIPREIEKNAVNAMRITWKIKELLPEQKALIKQYSQLQSNIKEVLAQIILENPASEIVTTTISILVDLKPEKFQGVDVLSGLKASVSEVSRLGDAADLPTVIQTQNLVEQTSLDAQIATKELEARETKVAQLEAQLTGERPATQPQPVPIAAVSSAEDPKKTIFKLLPWVVGAIVLFKLME